MCELAIVKKAMAEAEMTVLKEGMMLRIAACFVPDEAVSVEGGGCVDVCGFCELMFEVVEVAVR